MPPEVTFNTKPEIAIDQIRAALSDGIAPGVVLADAAYGWNGSFRAPITAAGLTYAVAVQSNACLCPRTWHPCPTRHGADTGGRHRNFAPVPASSRSRPSNWP